MNIKMPNCICGSTTPGAHEPGCPRQQANQIKLRATVRINLGAAS